MAERHTHGDPTERHETVDPRNPPSSVVPRDLKDAPRSAVGVAAMWYMLGPWVLIMVVIGAGVYFWLNERDAERDEAPAVGTIGETKDDSTPGGFDPDRRPGSTENAVEFRGGGETPQGSMPGLTKVTPLNNLAEIADGNAQANIGRRIDVQDVVVVDARDPSTFWVRDDSAKVAVIARPDSPAVRTGMRIDLSGTVEPDGRGGARIRATRVNTRN